MLREFGLLVTTSRGNEANACRELVYLLGELGDSCAKVEPTGISGIIASETTLDPLGAVEGLGRILCDRPYEFRYILRVIPIEYVVQTDLREIRRVGGELASRIDDDESFRVTVEKRFSQLSTRMIVEAAAARVHRKVSLEKPDKVLLVEVLGALTGMALLRPDQILSIVKRRMLQAD